MVGGFQSPVPPGEAPRCLGAAPAGVEASPHPVIGRIPSPESPKVQHHRRMEVLGILAVLLVVGFLIARSKGSSAKKEPPQAVQPPKPAGATAAPNKLVERRSPKVSESPAPVSEYITTEPDPNVTFVREIRRAHDAAGPLPYIPPPQIRSRTHTKVVDVPGTQSRLADGGDEFDEVKAGLPMGPVFVTVRLEANEVNPYALVTYVDGRPVGWMNSEWKASDPWVQFVSRLDAAGILPRFLGLHRLEKTHRGEEHRINFDVPVKGHAAGIASRIIEEQNGPPPK